MPVCGNCGAEAVQGVRFCQNCGAVLQTTVTRVETVPHKNSQTAALLAAVLGILLMGFGHFYIHRFRRGVLILIIGLVTGIVFFVAIFGGFFAASFLIATLIGSIRLALWAWQIYDAHALVKTYNEQGTG